MLKRGDENGLGVKQAYIDCERASISQSIEYKIPVRVLSLPVTKMADSLILFVLSQALALSLALPPTVLLVLILIHLAILLASKTLLADLF